MAWPILCETVQIKQLLETSHIQSMFHITKIEMGKPDSQLIKVEGVDSNNKKIKATFKVSVSGEMGTGCPNYSFSKK